MADRYYHVDVSFMHKTTCAKLREELGREAPLVFLALCAQAKISNPPGTFTYENDALGWERLGFTGWQPDFTLDEFFTVTGRIKQTSRRRHGLVWNVSLTRYGRWQKDGKRQIERERKSRYRAHSARDTGGTPDGTDTGHIAGRRTRPRSIPLPPNGTTLKCPHCRPDRKPFRNTEELAGHIEDTHGIYPPAEAAA